MAISISISIYLYLYMYIYIYTYYELDNYSNRRGSSTPSARSTPEFPSSRHAKPEAAQAGLGRLRAGVFRSRLLCSEFQPYTKRSGYKGYEFLVTHW